MVVTQGLGGYFRSNLGGTLSSACALALAKALSTYKKVCVGGRLDSVHYDNYDPKTGRGSPMVWVEGAGLITKEKVVKAGLGWVKWYNTEGKELSEHFLKPSVAINAVK